jgi:hypothetical protein
MEDGESSATDTEGTDSGEESVTDTSGGACAGQIAAQVGVSELLTCNSQNPCGGDLYMAVFGENPLEEADTPLLAGEIVADLNPPPGVSSVYDIEQAPCGNVFAFAFMDTDGNASGSVPVPGVGDVMTSEPVPLTIFNESFNEIALLLDLRL